jgi:NodT family efflux transporter outer membrane factor (OMF) lipoprotein
MNLGAGSPALSHRRGASPLRKAGLKRTLMFSVLALSGCAVGPDYHPPAENLRAFHHAIAPESVSTHEPPFPLDTWWEGFNDPTLTRMVQQARSQNLDLAAALARVREARAAAKGAGAQLLPSVDLEAQAVRIRQSVESPIGQVASHLPGYGPDQSLYDLGAEASWEIDLFGGLRRGREAALAEVQAAVAGQTGLRISVSAETADAYLGIRGDQAQLSVVTQQIETDQHLLALVRQRFERGVASVREVAQSEALLSQARAAQQPLQIDLEAQMNRLDVLLGQQPGSSAAELKVPRDIPDVPGMPTDNRPVNVLRRRPDIIAAERQLAAANARIGQAVAGYYPQVSLSGIVGYESKWPHDLFKSATFQPEGVAGLRWRLFDFGRVNAEVVQAKGADAEALASYRGAVLHAAEDVENAFTALVQLEAHQQELVTEVSALSRARDSSKDAYEGGVSPLTDVLDANRQLLVAQNELAQTRANAAKAAVGVYRALGGGW